MDGSVIARVTENGVNIIVLLLLLFQLSQNTTMPARQVRAYVTGVLITIIVILSEMGSDVFGVLGPEYRTANLLVNLMGFSISPYVPVVIAQIFDERPVKILRHVWALTGINFALTLCSPYTGWIFRITEHNQYARGPLFGVYVAVYLVALLTLAGVSYRQSRRWKPAEGIFLACLSLFVIAGTMVQVLLPMVRTSWRCIAIALVLYYFFLHEMQFKYDTVTGMLNRQTFNKQLERLQAAEQVNIVVFDLDKFKEVNDTYGHVKGDDYLKAAAMIIKNSFKKIGNCYRTGGDEFCVLACGVSAEDIQSGIETMLRAANWARQMDPLAPAISCGCSVYTKGNGKSILQAFEEADQNMYANKRGGGQQYVAAHIMGAT